MNVPIHRSRWILVLSAIMLLPLACEAQAPDLAAVWTALNKPAFDPSQVAAAENVELRRDVATIVLGSGVLGLAQPIEGRVFGAAFKGRGRLHFAPSLPLEQQQLRFHSGQAPLEAEFTEAVFVFTDITLDEFSRQAKFQSGDSKELQEIYWDCTEELQRYGLGWEQRLLKSLLSQAATQRVLFVAQLKTRDHGWLTLTVDDADPEQVELAQFDGSRRWLNIWSKFPKDGRRPQEAFTDPLAHHDYRLERYTLTVTVPPSAELEGEAQVELVVRRAGERVLLFALDPHLQVSEVTDSAGRAFAFLQPEDPKERFYLGDYLAVIAPEPFELGPTTLNFRYAGKRIVRKEGLGTFFCQSFGWYPTYGLGRISFNTNEFAARVDFDLTLRVPKKYQAVAVGNKVEDYKDKEYKVTRWQSDLPLAVAGFAFGDYKVHTEAAGAIQVEVYANKSPDALLKTVEDNVGIGIGGTAGGGLPGSGLNVPQSALGSLSPALLAKVMGVEVANSLRLFERYFGPYPYKKLAVANIPATYSYGQGWPGLLYIWAVSFLDSTQRQQLGIGDHVRLTDFFRAHETSHQWWGHAVGWKSYHDQWLSEGFAEFSGILYTLFRRNPEEYLKLLRRDREGLLAKDREGVVQESIGPIYAGLRLSSGKHPGAYSNVIYNKGGWVLHMLRMLLLDPRNPENPDARFIALMQDFTRQFYNQPASTEDFKVVVEKHMTPEMNLDGNGKMDWFFDSWVYGTGIPNYELQYTLEPAAQPGQFLLKGTLRQSGVPESFRSMVPLYFHQGDRSMRAGWLNVRGPETPFELTLPFKPDKVTINDWEDVLCRVK